MVLFNGLGGWACPCPYSDTTVNLELLTEWVGGRAEVKGGCMAHRAGEMS